MTCIKISILGIRVVSAKLIFIFSMIRPMIVRHSPWSPKNWRMWREFSAPLIFSCWFAEKNRYKVIVQPSCNNRATFVLHSLAIVRFLIWSTCTNHTMIARGRDGNCTTVARLTRMLHEICTIIARIKRRKHDIYSNNVRVLHDLNDPCTNIAR